MASVNATITVGWTSNYDGPHRVCYRLQGTVPYNCTGTGTHPYCAGGGAACSYDISITVDNETCDNVTYEGYVQPACEDESSLVGRIPFSVTFIPDPACNKYIATCSRVGVASFTMTNNGTGYTSAPTVIVNGANITQSTGTAVLGDGIITAIDAFTAGSGYNIANASSTQTVNVLRATQIATTGAGMTADVTFDAGAVITNIVLNAAGSGYTTADDVAPLTIDLTSLTDGTAPATEATIDVSCTGSFADEVDSITLTDAGSGYVAVATVTIAAPNPGPGVTATADVVMANCTTLTMQDCSGASVTTVDNLDVTDTISMCGPATPTVGSDYDIAEDLSGNCLCACQNVDLANPGTQDIGVTYIACNGAATYTVLSSGGGSVAGICLATDTINVDDLGTPGGSLTITVNSACDGVTP